MTFLSIPDILGSSYAFMLMLFGVVGIIFTTLHERIYFINKPGWASIGRKITSSDQDALLT